jgi:hypothetical protein
MKLTKHTVYIGLFAVLYAIVAVVSLIHSFAFFGLANSTIMSVMLGIAFEVGQAAVLFSILTSHKDRNRAMPWILMGILTLVQILGNVFSSYAYLMTNSVENLHYFTESILWWTNLGSDITTKIVTYIVGAILPVIALCMTAMITNYLNDKDNEALDINEDLHDEPVQPVEAHVEDEQPADDKLHDKPEEKPADVKSHFINL